MQEALRSTGRTEYESLLREKMQQRERELEEDHPGTITIEVEMGRHRRTPDATGFQELLDSAVALAEINEQVNPLAAAAAQ